jgi:hypothetical protein
VGGPGDADHGGADALIREREDPLVGHGAALRPVVGGRVGIVPVALGRRAPGHDGGAAGDDERPAGADERRAQGPDRPAVRGQGAPEVPREGEVVLEGEVDHPVRPCGGLAQHVGIVQAAADRLGPGGGQGRRGRVGTRQSDDFVTCGDEVGNEGGTDPAGRSGDENTHGGLLTATRDDSD